MTWVVVSAFIVVAAYLQTAGMLRLAVLTQLLSGYDVFAFKRFDVPRLPPAKNFEINGQKVENFLQSQFKVNMPTSAQVKACWC